MIFIVMAITTAIGFEGGDIVGIIVDIDMPQNCFQCPMARGDKECVSCQVTGSSTNSKTTRQDDCPILGPVDPAGLFADRDMARYGDAGVLMPAT